MQECSGLRPAQALSKVKMQKLTPEYQNPFQGNSGFHIAEGGEPGEGASV